MRAPTWPRTTSTIPEKRHGSPEKRHGSAGALRTLGGLGAISGPPFQKDSQSAVKTSRPRGVLAPRLPQKTRRLPSRVNIGKDAKPSAQVTRSRPEPSTFTRWSAEERPEA